MATAPYRINQTGWNPIILPIIRQVEDHPAFYPLSDVDEAKKILVGAAPFTYILWKDEQNRRYYLSFMNTLLDVEHRFFTQDVGSWSYQNGDPHKIPTIELLIPVIMHCSQKQCLMRRNPLRNNYSH